MPLGFSRSIFSKQAAAAAGPRSSITVNGDAQVDTARSKFGGASLLLDGTGDWLKASPSTSGDWDLTGDFTCECWFNFDAQQYPNNSIILSSKETSSDSSSDIMFIILRNEDVPMRLQVQVGNQSLNFLGSGLISADTWIHVAISRSGSGSNNVGIFCAGQRIGQITYNGTVSFENWGMGALSLDGALPFNRTDSGWIDEVRLSDTSRYDPASSTYIEPTAAFTNDANTLLLLHMNGSDGSTTFEDDEA